jgi:anti-sigma regulatory factor (Ser/Thr protein kinase)
MTGSATLNMRGDLAELDRLASWVHDWTLQHGIPERTAQQLDLCAAEAVTNVMTHGLDGGAGAIDVRIAREGDDVVLEIEDDGVAFDPTQAPPPPPVTLESDQVGGWGINIVRKLSDDVRYRRVGGRNCLTLVFHAWPPAAA